MGTVETVGCFRHTLVDNRQGGIGAVFQCHCQILFFGRGKGRQHVVGQILLRMGLGTHTDFYTGEGLGTQFLDDGLDAVTRRVHREAAQ